MSGQVQACGSRDVGEFRSKMATAVQNRFTLDIAAIVEMSQDIEDDLRSTSSRCFVGDEENPFSFRQSRFLGSFRAAENSKSGGHKDSWRRGEGDLLVRYRLACERFTSESLLGNGGICVVRLT